MTRIALAALLALPACEDRGFREPMTLGGQRVDAETLNLGRSAYRAYCAPCHGESGDGSGVLGTRQNPRPRDLRLGVIKYASVPAGAVPRDEDVKRVIRHGLRGTAMLGLPLPDADIEAIVHYTKTLSPRRRDETPPAPEPLPAYPWNGVAAAVVAGRELYHGAARCVACHPAYLPGPEARAAARAAGIERDGLDAGVATATIWGDTLMAPDLAHATLRSGTEPAAVLRVVAAGVGGTGMKAMAGELSDEQLWALVHYITHIVAFGGDRR